MLLFLNVPIFYLGFDNANLTFYINPDSPSSGRQMDRDLIVWIHGRVDVIWFSYSGMFCIPCFSSLSIEECHDIQPRQRSLWATTIEQIVRVSQKFYFWPKKRVLCSPLSFTFYPPIVGFICSGDLTFWVRLVDSKTVWIYAAYVKLSNGHLWRAYEVKIFVELADNELLSSIAVVVVYERNWNHLGWLFFCSVLAEQFNYFHVPMLSCTF